MKIQPPPATSGECVPHTPAPVSYQAWHEWAARTARTHTQSCCPGCGLWLIWIPKESTDA